MRILVTGHLGFIGSNLAAKLEEMGHDVVGRDKAVEADHVDILDACWDRLVPKGADVVIHLAALSTNKACQENPLGCFRTNVLGTLNLLAAANYMKVKQFIFASSEWVYGESNAEQNEGAVINTMTLGEYALSKHVSEVNLLQNYMHNSLPTAVLRFGIAYGPREKGWSVVESLFNAVRTQESVTVGSLKTGRNYIHIEDLVAGIIQSIGYEGYHIINLGGNHFISLGEIIEQSCVMLGKRPTIKELNPDAPSIRKMTNYKAKMILGWKPEYDLNRGLESLLKGGV